MAEYQSQLPFIDLPSGAQIVFEAIDPVSGAPQAGVTVANVAITYDDDAAPGPAPEPDPLLAHLPTNA